MSQNTFKQSNSLKTPKEAEPNRTLSSKLTPSRKFFLVLGLMFISVGIFLVISLVSYIFTSSTDQSVVEALGENPTRKLGKEAENWAGLFGAVSAYYLIFKGLGYSMLLLPFWLINLGYRQIFHKMEEITFQSRFGIPTRLL